MGDSAQLTLKDVASAVGVSSMTVSLALRNHPRIPPGRRAMIQEIAQRMGYRPNAMASALVYQRRNSSAHPIAAELAWINHWKEPRQLRGFREFDLYWRGAVQAAEKCGFRLEEFVVSEGVNYARLERILRCRNIQGILVPPHGSAAVTAPQLSSMDWSRFSIVRFGYSLEDFPAHVVTSNQTQGTMLACAEMTRRGYDRVGYVCHDHSSTRSKAGFLMGQMVLPPPRRLPLLELDVHSGNCLEVLRQWMLRIRPDAVLSEIAEVPVMLRKLGHQIPETVGLAATSVLDGNADAGIYQNSEEIGRVAVETLVGLIYQNQTGLPNLGREVLVDAIWRDGRTLPDRRFSDKPAKHSTVDTVVV